ncbi:hypothetical protein [Actinomadura fibrosa]|uniref:Uncharacterized protein n=1 Tax=Actinomadura fibrosa TaxID=111802 RepID=A0ABW2XI06_9ACTN
MLLTVHQAGFEAEALTKYIQIKQQRDRAELPQQQDVDFLDGLLGWPAGESRSDWYAHGKSHRTHGKCAPTRSGRSPASTPCTHIPARTRTNPVVDVEDQGGPFPRPGGVAVYLYGPDPVLQPAEGDGKRNDGRPTGPGRPTPV